MGTDAHKKIKGLLPLASLNKCLHDWAKEQKVAPMVVEWVNCECYCHEGDANLPFNAKQTDIKISLRMENELHHMLHPDVANVLWFEDGSGISIGSWWKWGQLGTMVSVFPVRWYLHSWQMDTTELLTTGWVQFECKLEWQLLQANTCNGAKNIWKGCVIVAPKEKIEQRQAGRQ
jgi:hypothetical protein